MHTWYDEEAGKLASKTYLFICEDNVEDWYLVINGIRGLWNKLDQTRKYRFLLDQAGYFANNMIPSELCNINRELEEEGKDPAIVALGFGEAYTNKSALDGDFSIIRNFILTEPLSNIAGTALKYRFIAPSQKVIHRWIT